MHTVHNFNPGPAVLPQSVLKDLQESISNFKGTGISILETSHRSKKYEEILFSLEEKIRNLTNLPDTYSILLCTGGASQQFSMLPLNLLTRCAGYILTGIWSEKALEEAKKCGETFIVASGKDSGYKSIPRKLILPQRTISYLHFTSNNTIYGTQFNEVPAVGDIPLICDASSDIFCKPLDISAYGMIYAGAQKNLGIAGVTLVLIKRDLLEISSQKSLPTMFSYATFDTFKNLYNTPPVFAVLALERVLAWLEELGGLEVVHKLNLEKSNMIYSILDSSSLYQPYVAKDSRSIVNITFNLPTKELEKEFLAQSEQQGMIGLAGHRSIGGIRISLYNAIPKKSVEALSHFMIEFEKSI
jgi:phosphoserine aminotransferase